MRNLSVDSLEAGMAFTEPVYLDEEDLLVPARIPIRQKDIERIRGWGVREVMTDGVPVAQKDAPKDPGTIRADPSEVFDSSLWGLSEDNEVINGYTNAIGQLEEILEAVAQGEDVYRQDSDGVAEEIIRLVREKKNETARLILTGAVSRPGMARSSVNAAILAQIIGMGMKRPQPQLHQLVCATLLHDTGMLRLPQGLVEKKGKLAPDEMRKMRLHPLHSYKIIRNEFGYEEEAALIALQHHERWDGGGYPRGLKGDQIKLHARILTVVDAFEAMVSFRPYRNSMIGYQATKALLSDNSRRFDPEILKVFIRNMGIYPVGSVVLLNDASIGQVVYSHPQVPLRPQLELLVSKDGAEYPEHQRPKLDLYQHKDLFIARAVDLNQLRENE